MKIDWKLITIGLLAAAWAHDAHVGKHYQKLYNSSKEDKHALGRYSLYLLDKLERAEVPFDEFDSITLNTILPKKK